MEDDQGFHLQGKHLDQKHSPSSKIFGIKLSTQLSTVNNRSFSSSSKERQMNHGMTKGLTSWT